MTIRDENRDKERLSKRKTPSYAGPLAFPEELKDPDYVYAWGVKDPHSPWRLLEMERKGYEPVKLDIKDHPYSGMLTSSELSRQGFVTVPGRGGVEHILMRLPRKVAEELLEEKKSAAAERNKQLYEDGTELSGTVSGEKQFVFKINN